MEDPSLELAKPIMDQRHYLEIERLERYAKDRTRGVDGGKKRSMDGTETGKEEAEVKG